MWKWKKEFFYFSKGDRIGILLLLNLIVISGAIYICLSKFMFTDSVYRSQEKEIQKDFTQFQNSLQETEIIKEEVSDISKSRNTPQANKTAKVNKQKLELGQVIDLNTATTSTLTRIPGIGITFADRIIEYRDSLGGFASLEQLYEIKGITVKKFSNILPYLVLRKQHQKIEINKVVIDQLSKHPYFENKHTETIIELRKNSSIKEISTLSNNENFSSRDIERMSPYLSFD